MELIWGLCVLCLAGSLRAGPVRKTGQVEHKAAPEEDVNLLMFGVIQLSDSLNYVYETTEANIAKIRRTLRSHEGILLKLGRQTEQAAEVETQMKEVVELLQAQAAEQQAQNKMTTDWLASMQHGEAELKTKVKQLETHLNTNMSIKELQERAEEHSNILKGLQHFTQFQKENIETQNEQLSKLQKMSESMTEWI